VYTERVSLNLKREGGPGHASISISISRLESPSAAKEAMVSYWAVCSAPLPMFKQAEERPLSEVGDVCYVPTREWVPEEGTEPVLKMVMFCRNNVYVRLGQSVRGTQQPWDLAPIAKRIDDRLVASLPEEKAPVKEGDGVTSGPGAGKKRSPTPENKEPDTDPARSRAILLESGDLAGLTVTRRSDDLWWPKAHREDGSPATQAAYRQDLSLAQAPGLLRLALFEDGREARAAARCCRKDVAPVRPCPDRLASSRANLRSAL
jgi:hypothetical protein